MCLFGCNSNSGGNASTPPAASGSGSGSGSGTAGRDAGSACVSCCPVFVVRSETVARQPADRARTSVGIGEEVRLSTDPSTSVTWTIAGDDGHMGTLSNASGATTTYTACDRAKGVTINAVRSCSRSATIAFTVVQPDRGTLESPTDISEIRPTTVKAAFQATPCVLPATVSFMNCELRERTCAGLASGLFASDAGQMHQDTGSWIPFTTTVDAHGTALAHNDTVSTRMNISRFPHGGTTDGQFHWPIPWSVQVRGGGTSGDYPFDTAHHIESYTAATRTLAITKGGQGASRVVP